MPNCLYCGKPAGLFRNKHALCNQQHIERLRAAEDGKRKIAAAAASSIAGTASFDELERTVCEIEQTSGIPSSERQSLLVKGWETAVDQFLEDGVLAAEEEHRLVEFAKRFSLAQDALDRNGAFTKTLEAAVLRDVLNGVIPQRVSVDETLPVNLQKGEQVVWVFRDAKYLEDKTRREYVGGSQGASVRIMKGLYYRVGAFKGHAVEHTERVHIDSGCVVVTSKHIYFAGPRKSLRIPYSKIVSFQPFSDGIGVTRDASTAKPQIFVTGDGWFAYNLITNLARL